MGQRSVRFPDELQAAAERMASEHERPFSWIVVKALEAFVPEAYLPANGEKPPAKKTAIALEVREAIAEHRKDTPIAFDPRSAAMERQRAMNKAKGL
jgi:hypothetical protein